MKNEKQNFLELRRPSNRVIWKICHKELDETNFAWTLMLNVKHATRHDC